jgi:pilus assembly protein CpaF
MGVGMIERIVERLVSSDVPLTRRDLTVAAMSIAEEEAPLATEDVVVVAVDSLIGLGPIEALLRDPAVSDVLVNSPDEIWVERHGLLERARASFASADEIVAGVERVLAPLGLRIDRASPAVDARLADGSRLHAVVPPISVDGPVVAVRRFTEAVPDLDGLLAAGSVSASQQRRLAEAVAARRNILISGGTGTGKTTVLNVLSKLIPASERVVTIEDAAELRLSGHVVRLEARPANAEGAGAIGLEELLRHALRLRPDRIVVGEVRGPEALVMIGALATGHDGSMSTVHASSPEEALLRLETLALSGTSRARPATISRQIHSAIDLVVQLERRAGKRRVAAIEEVA